MVGTIWFLTELGIFFIIVIAIIWGGLGAIAFFGELIDRKGRYPETKKIPKSSVYGFMNDQVML